MTDKTNSISFEDSDAVKALDSYFQQKSTMEILGVDRDENAHSRFLAWLFENEETRDVAIKKLISLLKRTPPSDQDNSHFPSFLKNYSEDSFDITEVKVTLEDPIEVEFTEGKCKGFKFYGRVDIVIDVTYNDKRNLCIVIENKIDSLEHRLGKDRFKDNAGDAPWQTEGYYNYYTNKGKANDYLFVYLTRPPFQIVAPIKSEKSKEDEENYKKPHCSCFIWIDYQDILTSVLIEVTNHLKAHRKSNNVTLIRIEDYVRCLGISSTQDNLIAVSPVLKSLVDCVWGDENNKRLLEGIKGICNESNELWSHNKNLIQRLFKVLRHLYQGNKTIDDIDNVVNGKDYTTYCIKYKGVDYEGLGKNGLVRTIVQLYYNEHKEEIIDAIKDAFPSELRMVGKGKNAKQHSLSNQVVVNLEEKTDRWACIDEEKNLYVIQTGWDGTEMMNYFINHAQKIMPDIDITIASQESKDPK